MEILEAFLASLQFLEVSAGVVLLQSGALLVVIVYITFQGLASDAHENSLLLDLGTLCLRSTITFG